jgi:hypothetical protein
VFSLVAALLRIASRIICVIVVVSFAIFAVDQTSNASTHQQNEVNAIASPANTSTSTAPSTPASHENAVHKAIDEVAGELTSPFSGITAGTTSQWAIRGVDTVMALLVYGLGLGYLARVLRVRV